VVAWLGAAVCLAIACADGPSAPTAVAPMLTTDAVPAGVGVSVAAEDLGGRNVLATANVQGAAGVRFEWYFERDQAPDVVTTAHQASYVYARPGFKDFTVRVTLADGRRVLGSGAVIVE
jgi:hypothetical protein